MTMVWQDIRYAIRTLLRSPGFAVMVVVILAVGMGGSLMIFSIFNELNLRPFPVPDPQRLALLAQESREGRLEYEFNYPLFRDYQRGNSVFRDLIATVHLPVGLGGDTACCTVSCLRSRLWTHQLRMDN